MDINIRLLRALQSDTNHIFRLKHIPTRSVRQGAMKKSQLCLNRSTRRLHQVGCFNLLRDAIAFARPFHHPFSTLVQPSAGIVNNKSNLGLQICPLLASNRFSQRYLATLSSSSYSKPAVRKTATISQQQIDKHSTNENSASIIDDRMRPLRKGDTIDVVISRIGYGGTSIGHITSAPFMNLKDDDFDLPVYAPKGACPGDVIRCLVTRVRRRSNRPQGLQVKSPPDIDPAASNPNRAYAEVVFSELIKPSEKSISPTRCKHFGHYRLGGGSCGGCTSMQIPYEMQLEQKNAQVQILFSNLLKQQDIDIHPIIGCSQLFEYRNKMEFSFGRRWLTSRPEDSDSTVNRAQSPKRKRKNANSVEKNSFDDFTLGLHAPQRFDKVVEIDECQVHPLVGNEILQAIREAAKEMLLEPFDSKMNKGYFRNVGIRTATNGIGKTEIMVNLITSPCDVPERLVSLAQMLKRQFSDIVCVLQNIRGVEGRGVYDIDENDERLLAGNRSYIEQCLNGLLFRISANSFFQTNPTQASVLFDEVARAANLTPGEVVLDLFCGTGSIGLSLAAHAGHVYGVDIVPSAITDAQTNAKVNGISNATFIQLNLEKIKESMRKEQFEFPTADVVVVDPPRSGLHPDLVKYLASAEHIKRIVYVSCNPMTQVRDIMELMHLAPDTFQVLNIQPVDMFPNTHHVECVVAIERRNFGIKIRST